VVAVTADACGENEDGGMQLVGATCSEHAQQACGNQVLRFRIGSIVAACCDLGAMRVGLTEGSDYNPARLCGM
jgi:hypothetical protein